jgi:hypothetical protein
MVATTTRGEAYATRFEAVNEEVIALVAGCPDERWRLKCVNEERSVAVVAHHIAEVNGAFAGMVERLASGETYTPNVSWEVIHESNAKHAREHAAVGKEEVLEGLRANGAAIARQLRSLADEGYDRIAGTFGDNELTVGQVAEFVVIGHTAEHLGSIRATVAG